MGPPICPTQGIAFAFPDVCNTPPGPVPVPYPNIAQLSSAEDVATDLLLGPAGLNAVLQDSFVRTSTGDEAGSAGGVTSVGSVAGRCEVTAGSATVLYGGRGIARFGDPTTQNSGNATGQLLGAFPTVLVGG